MLWASKEMSATLIEQPLIVSSHMQNIYVQVSILALQICFCYPKLLQVEDRPVEIWNWHKDKSIWIILQQQENMTSECAV